jgi:hypothetical protein
MPLARIISSSAKYSNGLADDLRSRGFQVLTSAPGDNVSGSADLEITLNECLAEEARAASDAPETKDMRVFLTPQAFAGNIRSIEMFVLTPRRVVVEKADVEAPAELPANVAPVSLGTMLEFAAPAPVAAESENVGDTVAATSPVEVDEEKFHAQEVEVSPASPEEWDEPGFASSGEIAPLVEATRSDPQSTVGRAILASRQSAWPNMAEMKLVPAQLAPAPVRPASVPLQVTTLPARIPAASSVHSHALRDKRFWKVPIVAGMTAVLALSAVWLANHFSGSHAQAGTLQEIATPSVGASTPANGSAVINSQPAGIAQTPTPNTQPKPTRKTAIMARPQRTKANRHSIPESDYVAKDTTVYFSRQAAQQRSSLKPPARP